MRKKFVLLFCNMNPYIYNAGTEKLIVAQINILIEQGYNVYTFFPINKHLGFVSLKTWGFVVDGKYQRMFSTGETEDFIREKLSSEICVGVFVHGYMYADLDDLQNLIRFRENVVLYIHDYYSCCEQFNLLRNDQEFCGDAKIYYEKCNGCKYYIDSINRISKFKSFFSSIKKPVFILPSELVKKLWIQVFPEYIDDVFVVGHKKIYGEYKGNADVLSGEDIVKVAFIGRDNPNKGYLLWKQIIEKVDNRIKLYHFGESKEKNSRVEYIDISVDSTGKSNMIHELRNHGIHVALLLSICPETYSYTYYEALASNCYIIANQASGNIAIQVDVNGNGEVIDNNENALTDVLNNVEYLKTKINKFRLNGHRCPEKLIDDRSFLKWLKSEEQVDIYPRNRQIIIISRIKTKIVDVLYRLRHGLRKEN